MNSLLGTILAICIVPILSKQADICNGSKKVEWKADPSDCKAFYFCFGTLQHQYSCEGNKVYSPESHACVEKGSAMDTCATKKPEGHTTPKMRCEESQEIFLSVGDSCSKYIDCTTYRVEECPYPFLFDENTSRCLPPERAHCGTRIVVKDPCDYEENVCRSVQGCVPCYVRYPSCKGLKNGLNAWAGREGSPYYAVCKNERVVYHDMCDFDNKKEIFNPEKLACESMYK